MDPAVQGPAGALLANAEKGSTIAVLLGSADRADIGKGRGVGIIQRPAWATRFAVGQELGRAGLDLVEPGIGVDPLAPLLEQERDAGGLALIAERSRPIEMYRPGAWSGLAAGDDPIEAVFPVIVGSYLATECDDMGAR